MACYANLQVMVYVWMYFFLSDQLLRGILDASISLVKVTLQKSQKLIESSINLIKLAIGVYLECVRLNRDFDNVALEKISHSIFQVHLALVQWVDETIGKKFGESKSYWSGSHWSITQVVFEIKVCA